MDIDLSVYYLIMLEVRLCRDMSDMILQCWKLVVRDNIGNYSEISDSRMIRLISQKQVFQIAMW